MLDQTTPNRALTEREVAARLGISLATIRRWRYTRVMPVRPLPRLGRTIRYAEADINRYLNSRGNA